MEQLHELHRELMTCEIKEGFLFWKKTKYIYFWLIYWSDDTFSVDFRTKYFKKEEELYKYEGEVIKRCFPCIEKKLHEIKGILQRNERIKEKTRSRWTIRPLFEDE